MKARQGDLLIQSVESIPATAKKQKGSILVRGESTGHTHRLIGGDIFEDKNMLYLLVKNSGRIVHEEHKTITLKRGKYAVIRQREYTMDNMTKLVQD